jgi:hypothetical protein
VGNRKGRRRGGGGVEMRQVFGCVEVLSERRVYIAIDMNIMELTVVVTLGSQRQN